MWPFLSNMQAKKFMSKKVYFFLKFNISLCLSKTSGFYKEHVLNAVFNIIFGNIYFVLVVLKIKGPKTRSSASS